LRGLRLQGGRRTLRQKKSEKGVLEMSRLEKIIQHRTMSGPSLPYTGEQETQKEVRMRVRNLG